MKSRLLNGLSEEHKVEIERQFNTCRLFREQVVKVLKDEKEQVIHRMMNEEFGPKWEVEQAYHIAQLKDLEKLISLF